MVYVCIRAHESRFFIYVEPRLSVRRADFLLATITCVHGAYTHVYVRFARLPEKCVADTHKANVRYGGRKNSISGVTGSRLSAWRQTWHAGASSDVKSNETHMIKAKNLQIVLKSSTILNIDHY